MDLEAILLEQQRQLEESKLYKDRFDILNNIIQIEILKDNKYNSHFLYKDLKTLFQLYILAVEERSYGYDSIERTKICEYLELLPIDQKVSIIRFLERMFKKHGFENEAKWTAREGDKNELLLLIIKLKLKNLLKILYLALTYNFFTIVLSLLICGIVEYMFLLPAPDMSWTLFEVSYHNYHSNLSVNRLLNIFAGLFGVNDDFKVHASNWIGVIMIVSAKILYILLLLNILIKQLISRVNI